RRKDRARALLDRREDLDDPPLNRVQGTRRRPAKVCRQEDQRRHDERDKRNSSTAYSFVVHGRSLSKGSLLTARNRGTIDPSSGGGGCVNSCLNGGWPRTPPATFRNPPPHKSAATPPGGRAFASRRAAARPSPVAAIPLPP